MMTIDGAIKHCEEVAEKYDTELNLINCGISNESCDNCLECAKEHRQLAEWLRKLKAYEEARSEIVRKMNSGQWSEGVVYGLDKAVRIMEKHLREVTLMKRGVRAYEKRKSYNYIEQSEAILQR